MSSTSSRSLGPTLMAAVLIVVGAIASTNVGAGVEQARANSTQLPSNPNLAGLVSLGYGHACYLVNGGEVKCWGLNTSGQAGNGTLVNVTRGTEAAVSGISTAVALTTSVFQTCALLADATVRCWGSQANGALGNGVSSFTNATSPVAVTGITNAVEVELRNGGGCVLTATQEVRCWGDNAKGAVGDGTTTNRSTPVRVSGLATPIRLSSGMNAVVSCAVTEGPTISDDDNELWCWGSNQYGQLNDGTIGLTTGAGSFYATPRRITLDGTTPLTGVVSAAVGDTSTCAHLANGTVWCWGHANGGRLGDGRASDVANSSAYPVQVKTDSTTPLTDVISLSAEQGGFCVATLSGGTRGQRCWGTVTTVLFASYLPTVTTSAVAHIMAARNAGGLQLNWCAIMDDVSLVCRGDSAPVLVTQNLSGASALARARVQPMVTGLVNCPISTAAPVTSNFVGLVSFASTSGTTPVGITLDPATGVFSGSTASTGISSVSLSATGLTSGSATATVTFDITNTAMALAPATQTRTGTSGTALTATSTLTATNRCSSVSFAVTSGTLPAGLTLNANTGVISGTPTEGSTGTVTITATDSTDPSRTATATVTFNVTGASSTAPVLPPAVSELVVQPVPTAPPTTTPSSTTMPPTTTTMPPTTAPLAPVPAPSGDLPELDSADVLVTEGGVLVTVELVVENDEALVLRSPDFELRLRGACTTGCAITEAEGRQTIHLDRQGGASVSGFGFLPGSLVHVWIFSEPRYLGALEVQPDGTYAGTFPLDDIDVGTHTLQANGVSDDNVARSANLGIVVTDVSAPTPATGALPATGTDVGSLLIAMMLVLLGGVVALASRRRAATTYD